MPRLSLWLSLAGLVGFTGLVLASVSGDKPEPSAVALAQGSPPGSYSEAEFSISDDAADLVLRVEHDGRSLRLYGDGRLEIQAGEDESYTRRLDRARMLEIFRAAVDYGLAEFSVDLLYLEIGQDAFHKPCKTPRVVATLRFAAYDRHGAGGGLERGGFCPDDYPQIVQSKALAELRAVLDFEISEARREGSIDLAAPDYEQATFAVSSDPTQLIMSFRVWIYGSAEMSLYGDGRLELRVSDHRGVEQESYTRQLTFAEMTGLVRLAVDHGFAEWNPDSLDFEGLTKRTSHPIIASGELHLDDYQRGEYAREDLARSFKIGDVHIALKLSADVLQVKGYRALRQALDGYLESARGGEK